MSYPDELKNIINIIYISVDQSHVRQQILNNEHVKISHVPSIITVQSNGSIHVYEANDAFDWLYNIEQNYEQQSIEQQSIEQKEYEEQKELSNIKETLEKQNDQIQQLIKSHELLNKSNKSESVTNTHINKIDNEIHNKIDNEIHNESVSRDTQLNKSSASVKKGNDLMSAAMAMQKERDTINSDVGGGKHGFPSR
jgi:predicted RNase H-like nuclease (RuvC/YqgF family)